MELYIFLCNFLKFTMTYVTFVPADAYNCCLYIFVTVHHNLSNSHPQTHGLFPVLYHSEAGMNVVQHTYRSVSMPLSGIAEVGIELHWVTPNCCPKWLQLLTLPPAQHKCSGDPDFKVLTVSEFAACRCCSSKT